VRQSERIQETIGSEDWKEKKIAKMITKRGERKRTEPSTGFLLKRWKFTLSEQKRDTKYRAEAGKEPIRRRITIVQKREGVNDEIQ